uniref:Helitron helicase-like domain-containing protein n=1 Tax=Lactuca sativa TaxID=4236 RepID=A0A9R1WUT9_LACSA|nr:hypothetical protein LSAT_V11C900485320 [Lactuca sativa]
MEFQKKGFPHCHICLFLEKKSKLPNLEDIDRVICAELPDKVSQLGILIRCKYLTKNDIVAKSRKHVWCLFNDNKIPSNTLYKHSNSQQKLETLKIPV